MSIRVLLKQIENIKIIVVIFCLEQYYIFVTIIRQKFSVFKYILVCNSENYFQQLVTIIV